MSYGNNPGYNSKLAYNPQEAYMPPDSQKRPYSPSNQVQFGFYETPQSPNQSGFYNGQQQQQSGYTNGNAANAPFQPHAANNYYAQQPQMFMPSMDDGNLASQDYGMNDDNTSPENEPPLLEELGINFSHIMAKTVAVLNPIREPSADILGDTDLAGPLIFCVAFGFCLLMAGKVSFGHIYLLAVIGCLSMYALLNLMSQQGVALILTVSILGYCLLPMVPLSLIAVFFSLQSVFGHVIVAIVTAWCSMAASKLFSTSLSMVGQQALIAYPCFLVYGLFALLAVF